MACVLYLLVLCALVGCQVAPADDIGEQIVGAHDADIAHHPWQVSYRIRDTHTCGGSILNKDWVLTTASCVWAAGRAHEVTIRVGSSSLDGGEVYRAQSIATHPRYNHKISHQFDVGLVRLARPITFNDSVKAVRLVSQGWRYTVGETLTVTGWSYKQKEVGNFPTTLQAMNLRVYQTAKCKNIYSLIGDGFTVVDNTMLCAGGTAGNQGCPVTSSHAAVETGGPALNSNNEQVGVVSWGANCPEGFPYVYSNLGNGVIRSWIESETGL